MVTARPAVSLTHFVGDDLAIIAHGSATLIPVDHPDFAAVEAMQRAASGSERARLGRGRLSARRGGDTRHLRPLPGSVPVREENE